MCSRRSDSAPKAKETSGFGEQGPMLHAEAANLGPTLQLRSSSHGFDLCSQVRVLRINQAMPIVAN